MRRPLVWDVLYLVVLGTNRKSGSPYRFGLFLLKMVLLLLSLLMLATVHSSQISQGLYKKMWVLESDWEDGGALYRTVPPEFIM